MIFQTGVSFRLKRTKLAGELRFFVALIKPVLEEPGAILVASSTLAEKRTAFLSRECKIIYNKRYVV